MLENLTVLYTLNGWVAVLEETLYYAFPVIL